MPVMKCEKDGKPGFKYGDTGFCYTYEDNEPSKKAAENAAIKQGQAIEISRHSEVKK